MPKKYIYKNLKISQEDVKTGLELDDIIKYN